MESAVRPDSLTDHTLKRRKISVFMVRLRHVDYSDITVINHRGKPHLFMYSPFPHKIPLSLKKLGPKLLIIIIDRSEGELVRIIHLHNVYLRQKRFL